MMCPMAPAAGWGGGAYESAGSAEEEVPAGAEQDVLLFLCSPLIPGLDEMRRQVCLSGCPREDVQRVGVLGVLSGLTVTVSSGTISITLEEGTGSA